MHKQYLFCYKSLHAGECNKIEKSKIFLPIPSSITEKAIVMYRYALSSKCSTKIFTPIPMSIRPPTI